VHVNLLAARSLGDIGEESTSIEDASESICDELISLKESSDSKGEVSISSTFKPSRLISLAISNSSMRLGGPGILFNALSRSVGAQTSIGLTKISSFLSFPPNSLEVRLFPCTS